MVVEFLLTSLFLLTNYNIGNNQGFSLEKQARLNFANFNKFNDKANYNESNTQSIEKLSLSKKALYTHPLYIKYSNALIEYNKMIKEIETKINKTIYKDNVRKLSKSGCKND